MKKKQKQREIFSQERGFTLAELMVAAAILIITIAGILISYLRCLELNEVSKNSSLSLQAAQAKMEEIKSTNFINIKANYDTVTFNIANVDARGVSYVDDVDPENLQITVSVSWRQKNGRVFGEDTNINGVLNAGEDSNGNGTLDSPVQLMSRIFER